MKKIMTLVLAAGLLACAQSAQAIDFQAKGQWLMGFSLGQGNFVRNVAGQRVDHADKFSAAQRVRLQMDAVASEYLSGTVYFEIGDQTWGHARSGGALGADGKVVEVKNAYIDWTIPETDWKVRMGIQNVALPSAAGGSAVMDDDAAGLIVHGPVTENFGLLAAWVRPLNDNYTALGDAGTSNDKDGFLDNVDIFALAAPIHYDGVDVTPWVSLVLFGQNALRTPGLGIARASFLSNYGGNRWNAVAPYGRGKANTVAFWAGLPVKLTLWDPLNIEFDFNYGYTQSQGRGWIQHADKANPKRFDTRREGWLAKALVEYKMDWGVPGIFGWYASGDDGNPKNGSERMPVQSPMGNMTSFMGDGNFGWSSHDLLYDRNISYTGTWGVGLQ
ncbi:MAG: outer membrane homotrimeric porin, partial [Desulfovibrio sp.]|nr:outer membrane homotrimeric porin [Desulfovibrio sp.]